MTRDRLPDLCAARKHSASFGTGFLQDVHIQISQNKKLNRVLDEAEEIRTLIQLIAENSHVIQDLHNDVLSYNNPDINAELDTRMQVISETASRVQRKLKDMQKDITPVEDLSVDTAKDGPIHLRIKVLQYSTMFRLFADVMKDYNESLFKYQDKYTHLLNQQKLLTKRNCTEDELQQMLDSKETDLFVDNILQDSRTVRQQLSDMQIRHEELLKIEKSIVDVRDMFTEMAFLVEKQGERLNCVEHFAGKATDNVDNGRIEICEAESKSHKYKKRKIKILIIVSIVILVLILIAVLL